MRSVPPPGRVRVHPHGIELVDRGEVIPLHAGAMHYFRHSPEEWEPALDAMKAMGLRLVDIYVPWGIHEVVPGEIDFGEVMPHLDLVRFLELVHERGLYAIVRPGPHINAELTYFGLPEHVVWDEACQARTSRGNPVVLPMLPVAFPVPSYASDVFHEYTRGWFGEVGKRLAPLRYPEGPIVLLQIDNEGALYFRDGPYDQDYHPDAIALYRGFLRERYETDEGLREAYKDPSLGLDLAEPPRRFDAKSLAELPRHLDWTEFHEHLLTHALSRLARALDESGLSGLPTFHNLPPGEAATPLNPGRIAGVLDLVGLDYYHSATPAQHMTILRRTTELVARSSGLDTPGYAAEMGAGFPPIFAPLDEKDSLYTLMSALAYGIRGFNLYMAVDRDRWIGAPIDAHGVPRRLADDYRNLFAAMTRLELHTLHRDAPVRLLFPRALRRLARAMHAFGPVTPAVFQIIGAGYTESCLETELEGVGISPPIAAEGFLRAFERSLLTRGVPFAYAGGDAVEASIKGARWVVCATSGGLKPDFVDSLRGSYDRGTRVTIGPEVPTRDGAFRPLATPLDVRGFELELLEDLANVDRRVARAIEELSLPTYAVTPDSVHVAVHEDAHATARAVFVMNPTDEPVSARVSLHQKVRALVDVASMGKLSGQRIALTAGAFDLQMPARTVRLFAAEG